MCVVVGDELAAEDERGREVIRVIGENFRCALGHGLLLRQCR